MMVQMDCANIELNANDHIKCAHQTRNHVHKTLSDKTMTMRAHYWGALIYSRYFAPEIKPTAHETDKSANKRYIFINRLIY